MFKCNQTILSLMIKYLVLVVALLLILLVLRRLLLTPRISSNAGARHVIVISVDALNKDDYEQIKNLPNFRAIMDNGLYAREVTGVNPSLTYPAHTTMITGVEPIKHGIIANTLLQPGVADPDWYWFYKDIKAPTLWDAARQSNLRVGALFWPVSAGAGIDYNIPEIWPNKPNQNQIWLVLKNGSPGFILDVYWRYGKLLNGKKQPNLDNFTAASATYLIKKEKPHLLFIHLTDLDSARHYKGVYSQEAHDALKRQDERLGQIIKAVKEAGIYDDTAFIVLGDHSFQDTSQCININAAFKNAGLISVNEQGDIKDWKVYANSCDGSAEIHLKDRNDQATRLQVEKLLAGLQSDAANGIEAVYNASEAVGMGISQDMDFVLQARPGYYFTRKINGPLINPIEAEKVAQGKEYFATHGYLYKNNEDYRTIFMASGPGIEKGKVIPSMKLVDVAPFIIKILDLDITLLEQGR